MAWKAASRVALSTLSSAMALPVSKEAVAASASTPPMKYVDSSTACGDWKTTRPSSSSGTVAKAMRRGRRGR